jgi:hypothetical protein
LPLNVALYGKAIMSNFEDLNLHDATLINVEFDWANSVAFISLKLPDKNVVIKFSGCTNVNIPQENSWGKSVSVNKIRKSGLLFEIEMQSGDIISITSESFDLL